MRIEIESFELAAVYVLRHEMFNDERGFFMESYRRDVFCELGIDDEFVQDNHSRSTRGVLRGLHFQWSPPVAKLMRATVGRVFTVAVDIRNDSPTLGRWCATELVAGDGRQVWAPAGFARGFYVLSDIAEVQYKCTGLYNPACESGLRWDDPELAIDWPLGTPPILSNKDATAQTLSQWLARSESRQFQVATTSM